MTSHCSRALRQLWHAANCSHCQRCPLPCASGNAEDVLRWRSFLARLLGSAFSAAHARHCRWRRVADTVTHSGGATAYTNYSPACNFQLLNAAKCCSHSCVLALHQSTAPAPSCNLISPPQHHPMHSYYKNTIMICQLLHKTAAMLGCQLQRQLTICACRHAVCAHALQLSHSIIKCPSSTCVPHAHSTTYVSSNSVLSDDEPPDSPCPPPRCRWLRAGTPSASVLTATPRYRRRS